MDKDNKLIFEAFDSSRQNAQLEKQIKMLTNNALKNVFAVIEVLEGIDSLPYNGELDSLVMNLGEEYERLLQVLEQKMPETQNKEREEDQEDSEGPEMKITPPELRPGESSGPQLRVTSPELRSGDVTKSMTPLDPGAGTAFSRGGRLGGGLRKG